MLSTPDIKAQLERPYRRSEWIALLNAVFNGEALRTEWEARPHDEPLSTKAAEYCARSITSLGRITLADRKVVAVYECEVNRATISEMRVGLRRLMRDKIIPGIHDAVFAVFHSPQQQEWRFTFVSKHEAIDEESGGTINVETAPKRYTYVLGPTQTCRTAAERFATLQAQATLKKVEDAFKVAPLFKEFYRDYHQVFKRTKELVLPQFPKGEAGKDPAQLFVQRLFNRLMFLAFIQRKGWLTINGGKEYLAALHRSYRKGSGTNFYRDILRPLFFEGLNQDERPPGHTDPRFGQVPYLNGGLFEKAVDTSDDRITEIPDEAFTDILHPDHGLFSRYNFTASENTPLDVEVAVDPEMLGKVFEELVTGRHEQGSYYTPKPIVSFMGRAALVEYLADVCTREQRDALEAFVHEHKADSLRDPEAVLDALRKVTVCDPACGSGAYLLGMLHELLELRDCLFKSNQKLDPNSNYERKLSIIERNLYGVDKDDFAVNIARLRLWLSLAVDFQGEVPPPLPNLDFKIETGDSLAAPAPLDVMRDFPAITGLVHRFTELKRKHLRAHGEEADALEAEIKAVKAELRSWLGAEGPPDAFQWAIEFAEVFLTEEAHSTVSGALNLGHELAPPPQEGGFDIIVANPPYVRMELIKPQKPILRKRFPQVHAERADLYVYFYARAHELLRKGGVAAFISTNKWLRSGFGEPLRRMLLDGQAFHTVMDFGDLPVFETATAYPCIFVWQKVARGETPTHWTTVRDLASCYAEGVREHFLKNSVAVPADLFGPGKPRLATTATAGLKAKMEGSGQPLGEVVNGVLGWGVKTGLNKAFIINRSIREQLVKESKAAAEVIKPLIEGEDVRRYELFDRGSYLIYTHHGIDIKKYPSIEEHLRPFRSFKDKKGKTVGLDHRATKQAWYELQQPQYAYKEYFAKPKIIYPDIGKELRFVVDEKGYFGANTTYFLPLADWYLCAVLNSSSVRQWIQKSLNDIRGGYLRFFGQHMEQLPIPDASAADRKVVGDLAKQAQTLHGERRAKVEAFLRALGIDPAESNSRNPLEQPWNLVEAEFTKRSKKLKVPLREAHQHYEQAREETAALTERIMNVEREIDERVATLYGLDAEDQRWAAKSTPTARPDDKGTLLFKVLGDLKAKAPYFSY
ncbi:MAG: Eco57I restriction-modification methylase domain-containing protein, partial [Acidobacteria bacterium]|nr:Eco57I restriction-modification methylase domain-containing protein [Acidobacteriota bacterium]